MRGCSERVTRGHVPLHPLPSWQWAATQWPFPLGGPQLPDQGTLFLPQNLLASPACPGAHAEGKTQDGRERQA